MAARRLRGRGSARRSPVEPFAHGSSGRRSRACSSFVVRVAIALSDAARVRRARGRAGAARCGVSSCRRRTSSRTSISRRRAKHRAAPLVLVCGHGTRDACCALRGTAVYAALAPITSATDELWISSHQGGHRFAANVLVLPAGIQLGRVTPESAPHVVARALAGRIELEHYRGRIAYSGARAGGGARGPREAEGSTRCRISSSSRSTATGSSGSASRDGREHATVVERDRRTDRAGELRAAAEPQVGLQRAASSDRPASRPQPVGVVGDPDDHLARAPRAACRRR